MTDTALQQIQERLRSIGQLILDINGENTKSIGTISAINKIHEKARQDEKITQANKQKLKGLYNTALTEAQSEEELIRKALEKVYEIRAIKNERRIQAKNAGNKEAIRRGALMKMLQTSAQTLPLWIGKIGESPPPLCGAVPSEPNYVAKVGDMVAALVRSPDGDDNWILAEVVSYNPSVSKYEVDDIDEESKEHLTLSRRRVVPLPIYRANPETDPNALFFKNTVVMALYPQTTCFYKALVHSPPQTHNDEYEILFEDSSYSEGYSPPLNVAQRYVISIGDLKLKP